MRVFGHPVHLMLVHFPIALCSIAVLWDAVYFLSSDPFWWRVAYWCLVAGLVGAVPTVVTGFVDFMALPDDPAIEKTAMRHLMGVLVAMTLFVAALLLRGGDAPSGTDFWIVWGLEVVAMGSLGGGAWFGGVLVLRHRIGHSSASTELKPIESKSTESKSHADAASE